MTDCEWSASDDRLNPVLERGEMFKWSEVRRGVFNIQAGYHQRHTLPSYPGYTVSACSSQPSSTTCTSPPQQTKPNPGPSSRTPSQHRNSAGHYLQAHDDVGGVAGGGELCFADKMLGFWPTSCGAQKINSDKKNGKYARYEGSGDDREPGFKMVLWWLLAAVMV
ncbi:uncharacterized protein B0H64DRAFT_378558 [Chaetomium fimeti]|uniref:Uncharacterized protein n=1 Tax=Chaetomium fimeti TaxID=1854472 RepID=A0AAE0LMP5_9PEZI|nr:hypothetical protein B0H64DRAFT_378558 [Chaetomium fimeti]